MNEQMKQMLASLSEDDRKKMAEELLAALIPQAAPPIALVPDPAPGMRLDLGCGKRKEGLREGFIGVDKKKWGDHVLVVHDLSDPVRAWPWPDSSVDEVWCHHVLEHIPASCRPWFANELWRVLKPGAKATIVTPGWATARAYGDIDHCWPPVTQAWYLYLNKAWREKEATDEDRYTCDFDASWGATLHQGLEGKNAEYLGLATTYYTEAVQNLIATVIAKK